MATYQTRHLEATREISHGDKFIRPGEFFEASEVDAEHYLSRGHAKVVTAPAPAPAAPARIVAAKTTRTARAAAPAPAPAPAPVEPQAAAPEAKWERTEPIKLADVPHPDAGTPPAEE